jgi:hypothetical protein
MGKSKRTTNQVAKKGKKTQKGGNKQPYYYVPVTKGGQLVLKSIELVHIRQFLVCLYHSSKLQNWILSRTAELKLYASGSIFVERIQPFFKNNIAFQKLTKDLDSELISFCMTFITSIWKQSGNTKNGNIKALATPIPVKGGQNEGVLKKIIRTVFAAMVLHTSAKKPRRTVEIKHTDHRRTIVGILFPQIGIRCIAKCSNNDAYIEGYKQEAEVYNYFESLSRREKYVCPFFGGVSGTVQKDSRNERMITINIPIPVAKTSVFISIARTQFGDHETSLSAPVYSLITDWNEEYCTLEEALTLNLSPSLRNRHLRNVMKVVGYLNQKYNFYHGDLKSDNIMVKKDATHVRCFDFDWSGIVKKVPNETILTYFQKKSTQNTVSDFVNNVSSKGVCFLLIFDAYRLFISWIWDLSKSKRFDVFTRKCSDNSCVNSISISNQHISFSVQDMVDFLIDVADTTTPQERTIEYVMKKICRTPRYSVPKNACHDWNYTLMNDRIVLELFVFIMQRSQSMKKAKKRKR